MFIRSSSERGLAQSITTLFGPPGNGKTFCAGTASKYWPEEPGKEKVELKDMLWVSADDGALDGFLELGITVPELRLKEVFAAHDPKRNKKFDVVNGIGEVFKQIPKFVEENGTRFIVIDTVSTFDRYVNEYFVRNPILTAKGAKDTYGHFRVVGTTHQRFHLNLTMMGTSIIYLFHAKMISDGVDAKRLDATQVAGGGDITLDITGQIGKNVYMANSSLIMCVKAKKVPGKGKPVYNRYLLPYGGEGFEGKARFHKSLDAKEEPHLGKVYKKIMDNANNLSAS